MSNVVDFKTGKAIFPKVIRERLEAGVRPHLQEGKEASETVDAVEQIICTALVAGAVSWAAKLASSLADKITRK